MRQAGGSSRINMKSNITDQQYFGADLQLSEPNFDDETTVLSAHPVVPLDQVQPETPSVRRLGFGLAILVAAVVGALGASLIFKQREQQQAPAVVETATPIDGQATPQGQLQAGANGDTSASDTFAAASTNEVPKRELHRDGVIPKAGNSSAPIATAKPSQAANVQQDNEGDELDERELRRAERRDARRPRRIAERAERGDGGGHRRRSPDDLLRIREIFEGSPRP
jgi:hypothetical protein